MAVQKRIVFFAGVLVAATVAAVGPANAHGPACGSTITADTTLTADLSCPGEGLVVAAAGVTLDLGGHTIDGPGRAFGGPAGIRLAATGVRVLNGRIQEFFNGVEARVGADRADVSGLTLVGNGFGVSLRADDSIVHGNRITSNTGALEMRGNGNRVVGNAIRANSAGITAFEADEASILGNSIVGDGAHDPGIAVGFGGRGVRVSGNSVSSTSRGSGIQVISGFEIEISYNHVFGNLDGITLASTTARVVGNVAFSNLDDGIEARFGGQPVIGANIAVRNGDLGIEAPGAVDAGGNRAFANGNPLQCTGVTCA